MPLCRGCLRELAGPGSRSGPEQDDHVAGFLFIAFVVGIVTRTGLGFHLDAALGGIGAGALLAVAGFVVGLGVHRAGFPAGSPQRVPSS